MAKSKTEIVKITVGFLSRLGTSAAATAFFNEHRRHSDNSAVEFVLDAATFTAAFAASGAVADPMRAYTDQQIDEIVDIFNNPSKLKSIA